MKHFKKIMNVKKIQVPKHLLASLILNSPTSPLQTRCQPPCPGPSASCCLSCQGRRRPPPHPAASQLLVGRIHLVEKKGQNVAFHLFIEVDAVFRYIGHLDSRRMRQHAQILQKPEIEEYEISDISIKSTIIQGNIVKANPAHLLLILSTYSPVFWLAMLLGAMCSLKSGPKYSK